MPEPHSQMTQPQSAYEAVTAEQYEQVVTTAQSYEPIVAGVEAVTAKENGEEKTKKELPDGRWTMPLVFAVLAAAFGSSFQFGYHIGSINVPEDLIKVWMVNTSMNATGEVITKDQIDTTTYIAWSWIVSFFAVGGMIGGLSVGTIGDCFGRKIPLLCNNAIAILGASILTGAKFTNSFWILMFGRFVIGLNAGLNSGLAPMYLMELSPANLRGTIGSCAQLFITIAILFSQILGHPFLLGTADRWPFIFAFSFVPVVVQLSTLPFCPESPKYNLVVRGRKEQAETDLKKLRQEEDVSAELDQMNEEAIATSAQPNVTLLDMFGKQLRWPLALAMFMMVSQQLSGINAAMFYSGTIFNDAGLTKELSTYATIAMGAINVFMTVVSVYLVDHPRFGRRTLHIAGMVGMLITTALIAITMLVAKANKPPTTPTPMTDLPTNLTTLLSSTLPTDISTLLSSTLLPTNFTTLLTPTHTPTEPPYVHWISYMSIVFVLLFVISFASGPGSIPWFYVSELFPSNARGNANSFAVFTNWLFTLIVALLFPLARDLIAEFSFFIFTAFLAVFIVFAFIFLPETKNKTLEEVQEDMDGRGIRNMC